MTTPADTDLAMYTDIYLRDLAYRTDTRLSSALRYAVCAPVTVTTNAGGDVTVPFPGLTTITGALVMVAGKSSAVSSWPAPPSNPGWINNVILPVTLVPWTYVTGGVGARVMIAQGYPGTVNTGSQGAKPAPSGTNVPVTGIAWGPA